MRVIGLPHDVVDANKLTQFYAGLLVPEVDVNLPTKDIAGSSWNTFLPQPSLLPFVIARLEHVTHPAEAGLRARPFKLRIAIENPGEDQIRNQLGRCRAQTRG